MDATKATRQERAHPAFPPAQLVGGLTRGVTAALLIGMAMQACAAATRPAPPAPGLDGLIVDAAGRPVSGAYVTLVCGKRVAVDVSAKDGAFGFQTGCRKVRLWVEHDGFKTLQSQPAVAPGFLKLALANGEWTPADLGENLVVPPVLLEDWGQEDLRYAVAGLSGTLRVKCRITVEGEPRDCAMVKTIPLVDERLLRSALERRRYRPALKRGKPFEVQYVFQIDLGPAD